MIHERRSEAGETVQPINQTSSSSSLRRSRQLALGALTLLTATLPASAHPAHADGTVDIQAGALHPFTGLDHTLAMLAVGLIAWRLGGRLRWVLPLSFLLGMMAGGLVSVLAASPTPGVIEQLIAASVVIFGLMLAASRRIPSWSAMVVVSAFALFHGYAHLAEGVGEAGHGAFAYAAGMLVASAILLTAGLGLGALLSKQSSIGKSEEARLPIVRLLGGIVATVGVVLLAGTF